MKLNAEMGTENDGECWLRGAVSGGWSDCKVSCIKHSGEYVAGPVYLHRFLAKSGTGGTAHVFQKNFE
jgi:hypothetical protein